MITNQNIIIILHYDWDKYIHKNLSVQNIINYSKANNYKIIEMYSKQPIINIDDIQHIKDTDICNWDDGEFNYINTQFESNLLHNNNIILCGGYLSQCIKWTYTHLSTSNKVYLNCDWVVYEPFGMWFNYWQIPDKSLIHIDNKISV